MLNRIYEENIALIRQTSQELFNNLEKPPATEGRIKRSANDSGLLLKWGNCSINLHSTYNSEREFEEMFKHVEFNVSTLVLFGIGEVKLLEYVKKKYTKIAHLVIIEPHAEVMKNVLKQVDLRAFFEEFKKVSFVVNENQDRAMKKLEKVLLNSENYYEQNIAVVGLFAYKTCYKEYYKQLMQVALNILRFHRVNRNTLESFRTLWLVNFWKNLRHFSSDIQILKNIFKSRPAIIVSAGPSLDENIDDLKQIGNKATIIAVGSAIRILESHGITPTFRMAIDATKENELLFEDIQTEKCPLIYSDHLYFPILEKYKGDKIHMLIISDPIARFVYKGIVNKMEPIQSGFSVANTALDLAVKMGANPIILIGQDLCYTEGRLHASGSWDDEMDGKYVKKEIETINNHGEKVYTDKTFLGMKTVFEAFVEEAPEVEFINATANGLEIKGMKHCSFTEVCEKYLQETFDFDSEFTSNKKNNEEDTETNHEKMKEAVSEIQKELEETIKINDALLKNLRELYEDSLVAVPRGKKEKLKKIANLYKRLKKKNLYNEVVYKVFSGAFQTRRAIIENEYEYEEKELASDLKILLANTLEVKEYLSVFSELVKDYKGEKSINIEFV